MRKLIQNYNPDFDPIQDMPESQQYLLDNIKTVSSTFYEYIKEHVTYLKGSVLQPPIIIQSFYTNDQVPHKRSREYKEKLTILDNFLTSLAFENSLKKPIISTYRAKGDLSVSRGYKDYKFTE